MPTSEGPGGFHYRAAWPAARPAAADGDPRAGSLREVRILTARFCRFEWRAQCRAAAHVKPCAAQHVVLLERAFCCRACCRCHLLTHGNSYDWRQRAVEQHPTSMSFYTPLHCQQVDVVGCGRCVARKQVCGIAGGCRRCVGAAAGLIRGAGVAAAGARQLPAGRQLLAQQR